jgi:hypothetical protein
MTFLGWGDDKRPKNVALELQQRFQSLVPLLADLAKLKICFCSSGLVRRFGEHSRCAVPIQLSFFAPKVRVSMQIDLSSTSTSYLTLRAAPSASGNNVAS